MSAGNTYWLKGKNSLMSSHTLAGLVPLAQVFLLVFAANVIRFMNNSLSYLDAISRYPALSVCPADTHFECANKKITVKKMVNYPKYQIKRSVNNQFYWVLFAVNGKVILTSSEQYVAKQGCANSIASSKRNVADSNFKRLIASSNQYYFLQRAGNYEDLGKSEMYESSQACENGIAAVKRDAPIANVEDLTI